MFSMGESRLRLLPLPLIYLILHQSTLVNGQGSQQLQVNQTLSISSNSLPNPPSFAIPSSSTPLTVSVALCAAASSGSPRFFVTNDSSDRSPAPNSGSDVFEILIGQNGFGSFTLSSVKNGGWFGVVPGSDQLTFEVGLGQNTSLNAELHSSVLFGDTTSNQALLFSPPFDPPAIDVPTFPNYTLPLANLTTPGAPSSSPNFTLILGPTSSFPAFNISSNSHVGGLPLTTCALKALSGILIGPDSTANGVVVTTTTVLRDSRGFRSQFLVEGLKPSTNYTVYIVKDGTEIGSPINFVTKSPSFGCPLVHSLPYCPLTSYAVPLPPPPGTATTYDASSLPSQVSGPLIEVLNNFSVALSTFPCGRDWYSPVQTCADCQLAYRTWLCAVQLPRCGEDTGSDSSASNTGSGSSSLFGSGTNANQVVFPALSPQPSGSPSRNPNLPEIPGGTWTELLPCLEVCNAADRACPNFLGFQCPLPRFNARSSYGVGYIDGDAKSGGNGDGRSSWDQNGGLAGGAQDRWGNVWCNGPGLDLDI